MRKLTLILFFAALLPMQAGAQVLSHWVQYGPSGTLEARALVRGGSCPVVALDPGGEVAMTVRSPASADFPLVCAASIPKGTRSAALTWKNNCAITSELCQPVTALAIPVADPQRIMVFGDTGCRIKGAAVQDCSDPAKWPFPRIAAEAAKLKPDLVIHVGDYLYRESACPKDKPGCAGTPYGDNWPTWNADFFMPAQPLLAAAPWVFVRGNHEDCYRAGPGWLRLLGPLPFDPSAPCIVHLSSYAVPLGATNLVVLDDTAAPDRSVDASLVPALRQDIAGLADAPSPTWLLMHRPIWGVVTGPLGIPAGGNATMIDAIGYGGLPAPVTLQLAGHIHSFEAINFAGQSPIPPLVVAGFGGDLLDKTPADLAGTVYTGRSGVSVKDGLSIGGFGFLIMTKSGADWRIDVHDVGGALERQCLFHDGRIDCPP
jgi:hypothetical protein